MGDFRRKLFFSYGDFFAALGKSFGELLGVNGNKLGDSDGDFGLGFSLGLGDAIDRSLNEPFSYGEV